jgi:hypothetical protein
MYYIYYITCILITHYSHDVQLTPHGGMIGYISVDAAGVLDLRTSHPVKKIVTCMSVIRML